jgi:S1-C subfamily serine protease
VTGVEIVEVVPGSPAEIAGLRVRDVMTDINGRHIGSTNDLAAVLAQNEPGSKITLGYILKTNLGWMPKETLIILADK